MSEKMPTPVPRLTVITLGVSDMRASIAFYEALGFTRRFRATGEAVAFFDTGGPARSSARLGHSRGSNSEASKLNSGN
jgi:catechol 2,3-dioxygenase-like lactoylglutathione lyase family enzyme